MLRRTFLFGAASIAALSHARATSVLTKIASPLVIADQPWEKGASRVQLLGHVIPPNDFQADWRMFAGYNYARTLLDNGSSDRLWAIEMLRADSPLGPWEKDPTAACVIDNCDGLGVYHDPFRGRYHALALQKNPTAARFATSPSGRNWTWLASSLAFGSGSMSLIRHQPFSPNNGNPFIAFGRGEVARTTNGIPWGERQVAISRSGDFSTWTILGSMQVFNTPDGGLTQPYGLCATSYGNKIVALLPWLHLNQAPHIDNSAGYVDAELVYATYPAGTNDTTGVTWHRTNTPFLPVGGSGDPDEGTVFPSSPVIYGDTAYFFYTAFKSPHGFQPPNHSSIMLATMPKSEFDALLV